MTQNKKEASVNLLRALAEAIEALEPKQVEAILTVAGLNRLARPSKAGSKPASRGRKVDEQEVLSLMSNLNAQDSRESAREYLNRVNPPRSVLLAAAKTRDIHILKQDTVAVIIEKLVANVVGFRLDSDAIRNG